MLLLATALVMLDAALTFQNVWPTPAIRWAGELSIELAVGVLAIVMACQWFGGVTVAGLRALAALSTLLILGHYADVTSQALFGRPINVYWDLRHMSAVGAMLALATHPWLLAAVVLGALVVPVAVYLPARWAIGRIVLGVHQPVVRAGVGLLAVATIGLFLLQPPAEDYTTRPLEFARPVSATYARQIRLAVDGLTGVAARSLPPQPSLDSTLAGVRGADVVLIFIESYGASSWLRPAAATALAPARTRLESDITESGRQVVSGYVESPTFGGGSWLAHISFLSGIEIRDDDTNQRLMTQRRDTFVTTFRKAGYRTVALMPGMMQAWPEGAFYGFSDIVNHAALTYRGPQFGWWDVPDQYSLYKLDALAMQEDAPPVMAFFPTVTTHAPFVPVPPYQPDWARLGTSTPFDEATLLNRWDDEADWLNLEPAYLRALAYAYESFGGYLRYRADRDLVLVLIGDHQPPALVTGPGASWDVPVHIIANRPEILRRLGAQGFAPGLTPQMPRLMKLHELTRVMLDAFGD